MPPLHQRLTHFLCLPLVTSASRPQWEASLKSFQKYMKGSSYSPTLCPEMIRPVGTLHITIGVMALPTLELEEAARAMLHSDHIAQCLREATRPILTELASTSPNNNNIWSWSWDPNPTPPPPLLPLITSFSGLQSMGNPTVTSIVFAPQKDPDPRIRKLALSVRGIFQASRLISPKKKPFTLHATILNTIYAPGRDRYGQGLAPDSKPNPKTPIKWRKTVKFDATKLLERYADFEWASNVRLEKLSLCRMRAQEVVVNGVADREYEEVDFVPLYVGD